MKKQIPTTVGILMATFFLGFISFAGVKASFIAECQSPAYLLRHSDHIIEGVVKNVESEWNEERTMIHTHNDLSVVNYKGKALFPDDEIRITVGGGTVDGQTLSTSTDPIFREGQEVKVYLKEDNGNFSIVCGAMGVKIINNIEKKAFYRWKEGLILFGLGILIVVVALFVKKNFSRVGPGN